MHLRAVTKAAGKDMDNFKTYTYSTPDLLAFTSSPRVIFGCQFMTLFAPQRHFNQESTQGGVRIRHLPPNLTSVANSLSLDGCSKPTVTWSINISKADNFMNGSYHVCLLA